MAMMRILSGDAAGAASRMSPGGGSMMSSYEQMVQLDSWQRQWKAYEKSRSGNKKASGGHGSLWGSMVDGDLTGNWRIDEVNELENTVYYQKADGTYGSASL